ncbi:hypothetical protein [Salibacterium lacus]|uniref:ABC transporter permease n=1 Tax=Salibacterium lacus TaxID=1898109 RepID=A0ABW5T4D1_9BACI
MMSSNAVNMTTAIGRLFTFKCRAFTEILSALLLLQLFAVLLSSTIFSAVTTSMFQEGFDITMDTYSSDYVIVFTMLWGFLCSLNITTKAYREDDFLFVTNRLTSHLSTILFLCAVSAAGGVTAALSGFLIRVLAFYIHDNVIMSTVPSPGLFLMGTAAAAGYVLLSAAAGYLAGIIIQWHRAFKLILPAVGIGLMSLRGLENIAVQLRAFLYLESSFPLFSLKVLGILVLVFGAGLLLAKRLEVRQ